MKFTLGNYNGLLRAYEQNRASFIKNRHICKRATSGSWTIIFLIILIEWVWNNENWILNNEYGTQSNDSLYLLKKKIRRRLSKSQRKQINYKNMKASLQIKIRANGLYTKSKADGISTLVWNFKLLEDDVVLESQLERTMSLQLRDENWFR